MNCVIGRQPTLKVSGGTKHYDVIWVSILYHIELVTAENKYNLQSLLLLLATAAASSTGDVDIALELLKWP